MLRHVHVSQYLYGLRHPLEGSNNNIKGGPVYMQEFLHVGSTVMKTGVRKRARNGFFKACVVSFCSGL